MAEGETLGYKIDCPERKLTVVYEKATILNWCFKSIQACKRVAQAMEDGE